MKTVLFYPRIENSFRASYIPLGILSIATYLNANGHEAVICNRFLEKDSIEKTLTKNKPDIIGVSVIAHSFIDDAIIISKAAKKLNIPVVWGASLPSAIPEKCLKTDYIDYISFNEGEYTWLEMANAFDEGRSFDNIAGLGFMKNGKMVKTPDRDFIDLSTLPDLDWDLVDPKKYFQKSYGYNKLVNTYMSKGCSGKCTYCYNPKFHHSTRRKRPIEQVIREMRYVVEHYGADGFDFTDDALFANRNEVIEFCEAMVESKLNVCWSGYINVGIMNTYEDYKLMYDAGCRSLIFGIESGSDRILKSVKKSLRKDKIIENVNTCHKTGIVPIGSFIIGLPGETAEDIKQTIDLVHKLKGTAVVMACYIPLPGSEIYDNLVKEKKMKEFSTLEEHAAAKEAERILVNATNVKTVDLLTVRKYIRLRGLVTKTGNSLKEQVLKTLLSTVKSWTDRGFEGFVRSAFSSVFNVVRTFTIFFHPIIRKRYGLYFFKR